MLSSTRATVEWSRASEDDAPWHLIKCCMPRTIPDSVALAALGEMQDIVSEMEIGDEDMRWVGVSMVKVRLPELAFIIYTKLAHAFSNSG